MVLNNLEVKHRSFGDGVITAVNGKYMTVKFSVAEKTFVYPDAFESFLTLASGSLTEEIENDLKLSKQAKQEIINKKTEENLRAMTRGIVIPGKEILQSESDEEENKFKRSENEEI